MNKILILLSLFISCISHAQNNLPPCNGTYWNGCYGALEWADGEKYVGEFRESSIKGKGIYTWPDGKKYVGEFNNGKKNGQGILYNANGAILQRGLWRDDVFVQEQTSLKRNLPSCNGNYIQPCFGTKTYADGAKYAGQWKDGKANGEGVMTWPDGSEYVGQWSIDMMNGYGTKKFPNGKKYVGSWSNDMMNGSGNLYNANGSIFQSGYWKDDVLIQALAKGADSRAFPVIDNPIQDSEIDYERKKLEEEKRQLAEERRKLEEEKRRYNSKPPVNSSQDIKRQKCVSLGLAPNSADFQQCIK